MGTYLKVCVKYKEFWLKLWPLLPIGTWKRFETIGAIFCSILSKLPGEIFATCTKLLITIIKSRVGVYSIDNDNTGSDFIATILANVFVNKVHFSSCFGKSGEPLRSLNFRRIQHRRASSSFFELNLQNC